MNAMLSSSALKRAVTGAAALGNWPDSATDRLARLWNDGLSAAEIAVKLTVPGGRVYSRCAVLAKLDRLRQACDPRLVRPMDTMATRRSGPRSLKRADALAVTAGPRPKAQAAAQANELRFLARQVDGPLEGGTRYDFATVDADVGVDILGLGDRDCRYILGKDIKGAHRYCGDRCERSGRGRYHSYCAQHQRGTVDAAPTARRVASPIPDRPQFRIRPSNPWRERDHG
jgi:hypothetical protein